MSPHPEDRSCEALLDVLEAFVDGDLAAAETAAMERHLESCPSCRVEAKLAQAIRDELRTLPHLDAPATVVAAVKRAARQEQAEAKGRTRSRWTLLRPSPVWALAAAFLLAAVLAPLLIDSAPPEVVVQEAASEAPAADEVARATDEVRVALAYVGQVTRRTGLEIRDGLIVERLVVPAAEGLSSLKNAPGAGVRGESNET